MPPPAKTRVMAKLKPWTTPLLALAVCFALLLSWGNFAVSDGAVALTNTANSAKSCQAKLELSRDKVYGELYQMPSALSILSWNIYKAKNDDLLQDLTVLSEGVDIVLLQEALEDERLEALKPYWRFAPGYQAGSVQTGVMTLSRWPAAVHCQFAYNEPWLKTPKATNVVEYALQNGERLLAINVHAINFTLGVKAYREQLDSAVALMREHKGPIVFAGDLNSWSKSRRKTLTQLLEPLGLVPTEFLEDNRRRAFGRALDYVWLRGVEIGAIEVPVHKSSDHNPLLVSLRVTERGANKKTQQQ